MQRIASLLLILLTVSCSISKEVTNPPPRSVLNQQPVITYTEQELEQARVLFIKGLTAFELEEYNDALDLLTMAYIKLPDHAGVNFAMADAYMFTGDFTNAAYYSKQAIDLDPENRHYHLKLAEVYFRSGQLGQVIETLKYADSNVLNDADIMYFLATSYADQGMYIESNEVYARIIQVHGSDLQIHYQRYQNFTQLEDKEGALNELKLIFDLDPENPAILQSLGNQYIEMAQPDKALEIYEKALKLNPGRAEIKMALADLYIQQNQWNEAGKHLLDVMQDDSVESKTKVELVQFLMANFVRDTENLSLRDKTAQIIDIYATKNPNDAAAQALAADFYLTIEDFDAAKLKLFETVRLMPENEPAWRQLIQLLYSQSDFDTLLRLRDEAEKNVPEDAFVRFFIGSAFTLSGDTEQGISWLQSSTQAPARGLFKSVVFGSLGDAFYTADRKEEAWQAYEQSLVLDPNNATALNNYAYYLSVNNLNLDKAYEMSQKSLEFEPDNPSYLDTLGWIYYLLEDYDKALEYIASAAEKGGSATVFEHLGDVYDKLGDEEKAQEWWEKSFNFDPERVHLLEKLELN